MVEYDFENFYVEGRQNVLADYTLRSVEQKSVEEDYKGEHLVEYYFCIHAKEELDMTELVAIIGSSSDLEESLKSINNTFVGGVGKRPHIRLVSKPRSINLNVAIRSDEAKRCKERSQLFETES